MKLLRNSGLKFRKELLCSKDLCGFMAGNVFSLPTKWCCWRGKRGRGGGERDLKNK